MRGFLKKLFGGDKPSPVPDALSDDTELGAKLSSLRRTAWLPRTEAGDGAINGSKFSGLAAVPVGSEWPRCGNCNKPMQLFLQLNSKDVPADAKHLLRKGILQLFYCTSVEPACDVDCEGFFPWSKAHVARVIDDGTFESFAESPVADAFPARTIVGWHETVDVPNWEETEHLGLNLANDEADILADTSSPASGEKLGGWPAWVQGIEYPDCRVCGEPMHHVFQIDSERNLPWMLGDAGVGHITRCREHPEVLTFGWACG